MAKIDKIFSLGTDRSGTTGATGAGTRARGTSCATSAVEGTSVPCATPSPLPKSFPRESRKLYHDGQCSDGVTSYM